MFDYVKDAAMRDAFILTYQAITNVDGWDFLTDYKPHPDKGFMFSYDPMLTNISNETERLGVGHSGASWAICMSNMQYIARWGLNAHKDMYLGVPEENDGSI